MGLIIEDSDLHMSYGPRHTYVQLTGMVATFLYPS